METVLLYQIKGTKTAALLKPVLLKLGIRVRIVEPEQYLQSIGFLAGNKAFAIVTTQNQAWNSLQLYRELKEEHEKMKSYRK